MFKSYECIKSLGYNSKIKGYEFLYKIIDSDFEEVVVALAVGAGIAVIEVYEKRNLNVAANLIKYFLYICNKYGCIMQEVIKQNKEYTPKFAKYEKEIERYLSLI